MAHPGQPWTARTTDPRRWRAVSVVLALVALAFLVGVGDPVPRFSTAAPDSPPLAGGAPDAAPTTPEPTEATDTPAPTMSPPQQPVASREPTDPPATPALPRQLTEEAPLRVWIGGDSLWESAGPALARLLEATGVVEATVDVRYSSGLTRPDYLDWHARATDALERHDPEVVLFLVGANDSQPLVHDGITHQPRTDGFAEVYATRTDALMRLLADDGRQVVWVGLPVMRSPDFDQRMQHLDQVHAASAARVARVDHVATRRLFSDADGAYAASLADSDGVVRIMRGADGVHLSTHGATRLASHLFRIIGDWLP